MRKNVTRILTNGLTKGDLERLVQRSIVTLGPVTLGQLGSEHILRTLHKGKETIEEKVLVDAVVGRAQELAGIGCRLEDRLATRQYISRRAHDFIGYCRHKRILSETGDNSYLINKDKVLGDMGCKHWQNAVYTLNTSQ